MFYIPINYLSVCVSAIISMALRIVWYSPLMFAKPWMKYSKIDPKKIKSAQKHMKKTYSISFATSFITAYIVAILLNAVLVVNIWEGLVLGGLIWIGFIATTIIAEVLFEKVHWKLFLINSGYHLISILVMSAILTVWF